MYLVIDAGCVFANALLEFPSISLDELGRVQQDMSLTCPDVYVDLTRDGRTWALNNYPSLFRKEGNSIFPVTKLTKEIVDGQFNWNIPKDALTLLQGAIKKSRLLENPQEMP